MFLCLFGIEDIVKQRKFLLHFHQMPVSVNSSTHRKAQEK